jgi:WD40 repeat protein
MLFRFLLICLASCVAFAERQARAEDAPAKITFEDHVRGIFREHCLTCHNQNDRKGDLALDSYSATLAGGASGEVVLSGDVGSSRLYALVSHAEEPKMPPNQDRLADAKLELINKWIEGGALENSGSVAKPSKQLTISLSASAGVAKPDGPPVMPEGLFRQPVVHTARPGAITALAASPWAPLIAVAGQKQVLLYHSESGQLLGVLAFPEGLPHVLKFSRSGALLLAGGGRGAALGKVVVFDVKTGNRVFEAGDEFDVVLAADIDYSHSKIALGGPGKLVKVFSTKDGSLLYEVKKHTDWVYALEFSPDGVLLATADRSNGLFVWEADTGREYQSLTGHQAAVTDVSWRSDSNVLASGSLDGTIRLWEMENGKQIKNWNAHGGGVDAIEFTHDGRIASTGRDKLAKSWDASGGAIRNYEGLNDFGSEVLFAHDGSRLVAGSLAGQVISWEVREGKQLLALSANPPTLEMRIAAEATRVADCEKVLTQAAAELALAEESLRNIPAAEVEKATQAKADRFVTEKAGALKTIQNEVTTITAEVQQASEDVAKKAVAEKLTTANATQVLAAKVLSAAEQAAAAHLAIVEAVTEQLNNQKSAAQSVVTTKAAAIRAAIDAHSVAKQSHAALVAEKQAYDQAQAAVHSASN